MCWVCVVYVVCVVVVVVACEVCGWVDASHNVRSSEERLLDNGDERNRPKLMC